MPRCHLATFNTDATVPLGHPLCGGWIKPAESIATPLSCRGVVLLGDEAPLVLCAVDWTGVCNDAHLQFRTSLARAAHTTPERVALHIVHQHNAPFIDPTANSLVKRQGDLSPVHDEKWFVAVVEKAAAAVQSSLKATQPITQMGWGQAPVDRVASNRRLLGADGKIRAWRASQCKDDKLRAEPEGLIDPVLRTLAFWHDERKLAVLHWYATHPMSYYGDGVVTSDFVGIARDQLQRSDGVPRVYFTGAAGNVAAGKYNDGSPQARLDLTERMRQAMVASELAVRKEPLERIKWRSEAVYLPPRTDVSAEQLRSTLASRAATASVRTRAAMHLSYLGRKPAQAAIEVSAVRLGEHVWILHLPGECFIEHQLFAQQQQPTGFVATAAYGDGGPWYVPTAEAYVQGGYEPSASFVAPLADELLRRAIVKVMAS